MTTRELPPLSKMLNKASHNYAFNSREACLLGEYAETHAGLMAERAELLSTLNAMREALKSMLNTVYPHAAVLSHANTVLAIADELAARAAIAKAMQP